MPHKPTAFAQRPRTPQDQINQLLDDLQRKDRYILELERRLERNLKEAGLGTIEIEPSSFTLQSVVSHRTGEPRVTFRHGLGVAQLSFAQAMDLAQNIQGAAEAALSDACLFAFLRERLQLEPERVGQVLDDFRTYRDRFNPPAKEETDEQTADRA